MPYIVFMNLERTSKVRTASERINDLAGDSLSNLKFLLEETNGAPDVLRPIQERITVLPGTIFPDPEQVSVFASADDPRMIIDAVRAELDGSDTTVVIVAKAALTGKFIDVCFASMGRKPPEFEPTDLEYMIVDAHEHIMVEAGYS